MHNSTKMLLNKRLVTIVFFLVLSGQAQSADFELGALGSFRERDRTLNRHWLYAGATQSLTRGLSKYKAQLRLLTDLQRAVDLKELTWTYSRKKSKISIGFQEVAWGESFGFFVSDLVNPRDYRDPLWNDMSWVRLPQFMLQTHYFMGPASLQLIFVPQPRSMMVDTAFLSSLSTVFVRQPKEFDMSGIGPDSEYGARLKYLFENGLDLGAFVFRHWNRMPVYALSQCLGVGSCALSVDKKITSLGLSGSYSENAWVLRFDAVRNYEEPQQDSHFAQPRLQDRTDLIAGVDWSPVGASGEGQWTLGGQYQSMSLTDPVSGMTSHWLGFMLRRSFDSSGLSLETFLFEGIGNPDLWFQPQLTLNLSQSSTLTLRFDLLRSETDTSVRTLLAYFKDEDRMLIHWNMKF